MRQFIKGLLCIAIFGTAAHAKVLPYIPIRSQSENAARELVLWQTQINLSCMDDFYGSFSITPEYTRTFDGGKLAYLLFNDALRESCCKSDCVTFKIQGSAIPNRDATAWLADNFGLPLDYSSIVKVAPRIENILADFNLYLGLDNWAQGLYFRVHAPLVNTRWRLGFCESVIDVGNMNAPLGYYNGNIHGTGLDDDPLYGVARTDLTGTFAGFVSRCEVPTIDGITFNPLTHARFSRRVRKCTKLSDIQLALGWNFWQNECYHFGLNIRGAIPTGSRPTGKYIFEPIVGNGKHWELGGGLSGHWTLWRSCDESHEFNVYLDANVTHLFKAHQCRTFDLCGKPLSRYMLASKMTTNTENLESTLDGRLFTPYQFANEFSSVANLSTIKVDVSYTVQADVALKFAYIHNCWQYDLGYELWARSCEKICPRSCDTFCKTKCCPTTEHEIWALKGDSFVYGFQYTPDVRTVHAPTALSSSENDAQIFCGTNNYFRTDDFAFVQNAGVDNALLAQVLREGQLHNWVNGLITDDNEVNMYNSFNPYTFDTANTKQWDLDNAQSRGMSHKLFGDIGYIWNARKDNRFCIDWTPYLGIGGEVEFGKVDNKCCIEQNTTCITKEPLIIADHVRTGFSASTTNTNPTTTKNCCKPQKCCCLNAAISQWGIWLKGGVSFN